MIAARPGHGSFSHCFPCLVLSAGLFLATRTDAAPPPNDDFVNRIPLVGTSLTFSGNLAEATWEGSSGEPPGGSFNSWSGDLMGDSVWWSWTAPESTEVTIYPIEVSSHGDLDWFDVLTGNDLASLVPVAGSFLGRIPFQSLTFAATAGTEYQIRVAKRLFSATAPPTFTIKLTATNVPVILHQPVSRTVVPDSGVTMYVAAAGVRPLRYQWIYSGGAFPPYSDFPIPGATNPILGMDRVFTNSSGLYSVVVTQDSGSVTSQVAVLQVREPDVLPTLTALQVGDGEFRFELSGEAWRTYGVESSTNLLDWDIERSFPNSVNLDEPKSNHTEVFTVLLTSSTMQLTVPAGAARKFYRAWPVLLDDSRGREECLNHLRQINIAKYLWASEHHYTAEATSFLSDLAPYLGGEEKVAAMSCPYAWPFDGFAASYFINAVRNPPTCRYVPWDHILAE